MDELKRNLGKIVLGLSMVVVAIDTYVVLRYFEMPKVARHLIGWAGNAFTIYLKHVVFGWVVFAVILAVATYFLNGLLLETSGKEEQYRKTGSVINLYAGGLAVIFLIVGLFS